MSLAMLWFGLARLSAQVPPPPTPPPPGQSAGPAAAAAAPAQPTPPTDSLVFSTDAALVLHAIKSDKVGDFEAVMARLREALQGSADPMRRQQGASWKILKAAEPGPAGAVLYVFVIDPVVKGADYTVSRILAEAFPDEVGVLWGKLRDVYAGGLNRLSLQVLPVSPPAPGPKPEAPSPRP